MKILLLICILLNIVLSSASTGYVGEAIAVSVLPNGSLDYTSIHRAEDDKHAPAVGHIDTSAYYRRGWAHMVAETRPGHPDADQALALGGVHGYLQYQLANNHLRNWLEQFAEKFPDGKISDKWWDFMRENMNFVANNAAKAGTPTETRVRVQADLLRHTALGFVDGFNHHARELNAEAWMTPEIVWSFNSYGDSYEILPFLHPETHVPSHAAPDSDEFVTWEHTTRECSAALMRSANGKDFFATHSTWTSYTGMIRVFVHLKLSFTSLVDHLGAPAYVSYSSKPGFVHGKDDHMANDHGVHAHETTISVFDAGVLAEHVTPQRLFSWQREQAAIRLAHNAEEWVDSFAVDTSGTYAGTWVAVSLNEFDPSTGLLNDKAAFMHEEIPGYFSKVDITNNINELGYYASYNVHRTALIDDKSGNKAIRERLQREGKTAEANEHDAALCTRAKLFARELHSRLPTSQGDALRVIRSNDYQTNPISAGDPHAAICARYDLMPVGHRLRQTFGCIDGKVVSHGTYKAGRGWRHLVQAGPTWGWQTDVDGQRTWVEPFSWSKYEAVDPKGASPHKNQQDEFRNGPIAFDYHVYDFGK